MSCIAVTAAPAAAAAGAGDGALTLYKPGDKAFPKKMVRFRETVVFHQNVPLVASQSTISLLSALGRLNTDESRVRLSYVVKLREKLKVFPTAQATFGKMISQYSKLVRSDTEKLVERNNAQLIFSSFKKTEKVKIPTTEEMYLHACEQRDFIFTRIDLPLLADIFQTSVCIYDTTGNCSFDLLVHSQHKVVLLEVQEQAYSITQIRQVVQWLNCFIPVGENDTTAHRAIVDYTFMVYPQYQLLESLSFSQKARNFLNQRLVTRRVDLACQCMESFRDIFKIYGSVKFFNDILDFLLVLDPESKQEMPFGDLVNLGMQDVLDNEQWSSNLVSLRNWNFVSRFSAQVSHLAFPRKIRAADLAVEVVHDAQFPQLNSFVFPESWSIERIIAVLNRNLKWNSLAFEKMTFAEFEKIRQSRPEQVKLLASLHFGSTPVTNPMDLVQLFTACPSLQKISINAPELWSHEEVQKAILNCSTLHSIDFMGKLVPYVRGAFVPYEFLKKLIQVKADRSTGIFLAEFGNQVPLGRIKEDLEVLYLSNFKTETPRNENLIDFVVNVKKWKKISVLANPRFFNNLSFFNWSLRKAAPQLAPLELLDLRGCYFRFNQIPYLAKLKSLKQLKLGGFVYHDSSWPENYRDYRDDEDEKETRKYKNAIQKALPLLQKEAFEFSMLVYRQYYGGPAP